MGPNVVPPRARMASSFLRSQTASELLRRHTAARVLWVEIQINLQTFSWQINNNISVIYKDFSILTNNYISVIFKEFSILTNTNILCRNFAMNLQSLQYTSHFPNFAFLKVNGL